ncbi:FAD-dependent oxidoreductase [Candidatus Palauibacter sp.]|uniref:FAD-dependent oxidoreductase n=1 Tax=Candidatus Palauibacter sp. TaxID=3101350 RepID=UPI003B5B38BA
MSERAPQPTAASIAVIGAGIVGSCLVEHLARRGWDDLVLIDKGPLPDPGGSTGHASNFIFPTDHNREVAMLTLESQRQYEALGVRTTCGGAEVARTEARMEELRRRMTSARAWGIEAELLTPGQVAERIPFVNPDVILGGFWTPSVSVVDAVRAGTLMRERALSRGALTVLDDTEVTGLEVAPRSCGRPRVRAVLTARGRIEVEHAVIACGVWSPLVAELAGVSIPLTPAVHQMTDLGPVDVLRATGNEIGHPIVRHMDAFMYERQSHEAMEVGSYAHRPILVRPEDIPSREASELSPTEMPFTGDDFSPQLAQAREIMGELLDGTEIGYAINGLLSLTPDAQPVLGETAEVANLWSAAAVWIKECRISYVGESGWEIYVAAPLAPRVWDAVSEAGRAFGLRPVGGGVYGTTGRMEKGYALMGAELTSEYSPVEAGLARPRVKRADFIGRAAYLRAREAGPAAKLRTLTMDGHADASGLARFPTGGNEPLLGPDGERILDARGRESRVTSAGMGPSVGKYLLMAYLPPELAVSGTRLRVLYMNEPFPVTVAADTALFDPSGARMRS